MAARDPADVARAIGGAQAQDRRAGLLHFRSRARELTASRVERARVEERSLVRGWLMRGTVHLVAADDYAWMLPLFAEAISRESRRRLAQLGMPANDQDRAFGIVERALAGDGVLSRNEIVERLARGGLSLLPETRIHLMRLVVADGTACIGPDQGGHGSLALAEDWLGGGVGGERVERDVALAELARRYLGAFAPATERDFAKWSGLPLRDCRRGLNRIAPEIAELGDWADSGGRGAVSRPTRSGRGRGATLLALRDTKLRVPGAPLVRLLGGFDTYLMGYASRSHAVDDAGERRILPGGGVLRPTICVDGRFAGTWSSKRNGDRLEASIEPFGELGEQTLSAIEAEIADVGRFEGARSTRCSGIPRERRRSTIPRR